MPCKYPAVATISIVIATLVVGVQNCFADRVDALVASCNGGNCEVLAEQCRSMVSTLNVAGKKIEIEDLALCNEGSAGYSIMSKSADVIAVKLKDTGNIWMRALSSTDTSGMCISSTGTVVTSGVAINQC